MLANKAIICLYCPLLLLLIDYLLASGYQKTKSIPSLKHVWSMRQRTPNDRYSLLCFVWRLFCKVDDDKNKNFTVQDFNQSFNGKQEIINNNMVYDFIRGSSKNKDPSTFDVSLFQESERKKYFEKRVKHHLKRTNYFELKNLNRNKMTNSRARLTKNIHKTNFLMNYKSRYKEKEFPLQEASSVSKDYFTSGMGDEKNSSQEPKRRSKRMSKYKNPLFGDSISLFNQKKYLKSSTIFLPQSLSNPNEAKGLSATGKDIQTQNTENELTTMNSLKFDSFEFKQKHDSDSQGIHSKATLQSKDESNNPKIELKNTIKSYEDSTINPEKDIKSLKTSEISTSESDVLEMFQQESNFYVNVSESNKETNTGTSIGKQLSTPKIPFFINTGSNTEIKTHPVEYDDSNENSEKPIVSNPNKLDEKKNSYEIHNYFITTISSKQVTRSSVNNELPKQQSANESIILTSIFPTEYTHNDKSITSSSNIDENEKVNHEDFLPRILITDKPNSHNSNENGEKTNEDIEKKLLNPINTEISSTKSITNSSDESLHFTEVTSPQIFDSSTTIPSTFIIEVDKSSDGKSSLSTSDVTKIFFRTTETFVNSDLTQPFTTAKKPSTTLDENLNYDLSTISEKPITSLYYENERNFAVLARNSLENQPPMMTTEFIPSKNILGTSSLSRTDNLSTEISTLSESLQKDIVSNSKRNENSNAVIGNKYISISVQTEIADLPDEKTTKPIGDIETRSISSSVGVEDTTVVSKTLIPIDLSVVNKYKNLRDNSVHSSSYTPSNAFVSNTYSKTNSYPESSSSISSFENTNVASSITADKKNSDILVTESNFYTGKSSATTSYYPYPYSTTSLQDSSQENDATFTDGNPNIEKNLDESATKESSRSSEKTSTTFSSYVALTENYQSNIDSSDFLENQYFSSTLETNRQHKDTVTNPTIHEKNLSQSKNSIILNTSTVSDDKFYITPAASTFPTNTFTENSFESKVTTTSKDFEVTDNYIDKDEIKIPSPYTKDIFSTTTADISTSLDLFTIDDEQSTKTKTTYLTPLETMTESYLELDPSLPNFSKTSRSTEDILPLETVSKSTIPVSPSTTDIDANAENIPKRLGEDGVTVIRTERDLSKCTEDTPKDNVNSESGDSEVIRTERDLSSVGGGINAESSFGLGDSVKENSIGKKDESIQPNMGVGYDEKETFIPTLEPPSILPVSLLSPPTSQPENANLNVNLGISGGESGGASVNAEVDLGGISGGVNLDLSGKTEETKPSEQKEVSFSENNLDISFQTESNIDNGTKNKVSEGTINEGASFTTNIPSYSPEEKMTVTYDENFHFSTSDLKQVSGDAPSTSPIDTPSSSDDHVTFETGSKSTITISPSTTDIDANTENMPAGLGEDGVTMIRTERDISKYTEDTPKGEDILTTEDTLLLEKGSKSKITLSPSATDTDIDTNTENMPAGLGEDDVTVIRTERDISKYTEDTPKGKDILTTDDTLLLETGSKSTITSSPSTTDIDTNTENMPDGLGEDGVTMIRTERDISKYTEDTPKDNVNSESGDSEVIRTERDHLSVAGGINAGTKFGLDDSMKESSIGEKDESISPNMGVGSNEKETLIPTLEPPSILPDFPLSHSTSNLDINSNSSVGTPGNENLKVNLGISGGDSGGAAVNANVDLGGFSGGVNLDLSGKTEETIPSEENEASFSEKNLDISFQTESNIDYDNEHKVSEGTINVGATFKTNIPSFNPEEKMTVTYDENLYLSTSDLEQVSGDAPSTSSINTPSSSDDHVTFETGSKSTITLSPPTTNIDPNTENMPDGLGEDDVTVIRTEKDILKYTEDTPKDEDILTTEDNLPLETGSKSTIPLSPSTTDIDANTENMIEGLGEDGVTMIRTERDISKYTEDTPKDNVNSESGDLEVIRTERDLTSIGGGINAGASIGLDDGIKENAIGKKDESILPNMGVGSDEEETFIPSLEPPNILPDSPLSPPTSDLDINSDSSVGAPGNANLNVNLGISGGEKSEKKDSIGASVNANVDLGGISGGVNLDLSGKTEETIPSEQKEVSFSENNFGISFQTESNIDNGNKQKVSEGTTNVGAAFTTNIPSYSPEEKMTVTYDENFLFSTSDLEQVSGDAPSTSSIDSPSSTESLQTETSPIEVLTLPNILPYSSTTRNIYEGTKPSSLTTDTIPSTIPNKVTTIDPLKGELESKIGERDVNTYDTTSTVSPKPSFLRSTTSTEAYSNIQTIISTTESSNIPFHFTIDADYDEVVGAKKEMFEENLTRQLGIAMRLPFECVQNVQVSKGSINVDFEIQPSSEHGHMADEKAIKAAADELKRMIDTGQLTINDLEGNTLVVVPLDPPTKPPPANEMEHTTLILGVIIGAFILTVIMVAITAIIVKRKSNGDHRLTPIEEARSKLPSYRDIPFQEALFIKGSERNKLMYGKYCYNTGQWMGPGPEPRFFQAPESIIYRPPTDSEIRQTPRPPTAVRERLKHQWEVDWDSMVSSR